MKDYSLRQVAMVCCLAGFALLAGGCKKQVGAPPPAAAPAPAPAQPTVTINASTTSVNAGEAVTLTHVDPTCLQVHALAGANLKDAYHVIATEEARATP